MKRGIIYTMLAILLGAGCTTGQTDEVPGNREVVALTPEQASHLAKLPLACMQTAYPNKLGQTLGSQADMGEPQFLHPAFYGCFDWHSAVHAHWSLVKLLKMFPELEGAIEIRQKLEENLTASNIFTEVEYFNRSEESSYERTYGWAWLLKLVEELHSWDDPMGNELEKNLQPLTELIVERYKAFLPKLVYPIRVGEHSNTAFGMSFAWDYANTLQDSSLKAIIESRARDFYLSDASCPMAWEPSGFDFLSPCLEEIDLMRRVLDEYEFPTWMGDFAPQLLQQEFVLEPGRVSDRSDGKLVHLDGLNFSRAWVLYGLAHQYPAYEHLLPIADAHVTYSLPNLIGDSYEGGHWLGSFALYALQLSK
ncbi:MAG: DUF2891 domain-containing protein [Bacteroidetes bacterium]|nr:MAG: DUF2891 domain-containing protein [Bacteroidota bacterium]